MNKETYRKFTKIQTPSIFTLMGRNRGKRNLRDGIAEKMSEKMHMSHAEAISMFPYLEIMFKDDELAWEISDFLELEENEIKRFRKKKIPKKVRKSNNLCFILLNFGICLMRKIIFSVAKIHQNSNILI